MVSLFAADLAGASAKRNALKIAQPFMAGNWNDGNESVKRTAEGFARVGRETFSRPCYGLDISWPGYPAINGWAIFKAFRSADAAPATLAPN